MLQFIFFSAHLSRWTRFEQIADQCSNTVGHKCLPVSDWSAHLLPYQTVILIHKQREKTVCIRQIIRLPLAKLFFLLFPTALNLCVRRSKTFTSTNFRKWKIISKQKPIIESNQQLWTMITNWIENVRTLAIHCSHMKKIKFMPVVCFGFFTREKSTLLNVHAKEFATLCFHQKFNHTLVNW